jgi:hypothetical protein
MIQAQQFTLHVADPTRPSPLVQFSGIEYPSLCEASKAIAGQYGDFLALEILGRAFVLDGTEATKFSEQGVPYMLGLSNGESFSRLQGKFTGSTEHVRWGDNTEPTLQEITFEATEHPTATDAFQHLDFSDHDQVMLIAGRVFSMTDAEAARVYGTGLQMAFVEKGKFTIGGRPHRRLVHIPVNDNGAEPVIEGVCPMTLKPTPQGHGDNFLEITESPEILEITAERRRAGACLRKKGTIGQEYEYEVQMSSQASEYGLNGKNIIFLRMKAPDSGITNHILAEYMDNDWDILIPIGPNDLLAQAIAKLVDYYAPKD